MINNSPHTYSSNAYQVLKLNYNHKHRVYN